MNNQIANPKVEVKTGIGLNEKDYITCLNTTLKEMTKNYAIAMTEASNQSLYEVYSNIFTKLSNLQREVYEVMFRKGWYVLESSEVTKIDTKYQTLQKEYSDLNN